MEELIKKLREAQSLAHKLREEELRRPFLELYNRFFHEQPRSTEERNWLEELKSELGTVDRPLVILSLFDGIGGIWAALDRLEIPYIGYSCEINPYANKVLKARFPGVKHLGDVRNIERTDIEEEVIDLLVGGFPCQDLTIIGKRDGLHGLKSRLFFDMLHVLYDFKPRWFLAENVASMAWIEREEISKFLNCYPIEIDAEELTATKRRRFYWTNIPLPKNMPKVRYHKSSLLQSVLDNATALEDKTGCIVSRNTGLAAVQSVYDNTAKALRRLTITELEKLLGFPPGHTDVDMGPEERQRANRCAMLGNSFSVPVVSYMLTPLLKTSTWESHVPHKFSPKFKESECSVMEVGEVWALYNERNQPGWYAVILSRSGGRFCSSYKLSKKRRLQIEVCFLTLDANYLALESDKWSPFRGTGTYMKTESPDVQDSFLSFSHKMSTLQKTGDDYFIYPGKNEIWAVHDDDLNKKYGRTGLYYVYITESSIDELQGGKRKPGNEGFIARCKVMQQNGSPEVYRCTDTETVMRNLAVFSFKVPYYYKCQAGSYVLETSKKHIQPKPASKKRKSRDGDDDEDDDDEGVLEEEDEVNDVSPA